MNILQLRLPGQGSVAQVQNQPDPPPRDRLSNMGGEPDVPQAQGVLRAPGYTAASAVFQRRLFQVLHITPVTSNLPQ